MKFKKGDLIKHEGYNKILYTRKVLAVIDDALYITSFDEDHESPCGTFFTEENLQDYTLVEPAKEDWTPARNIEYYCSDITLTRKYVIDYWNNDNTDNYRKSLGLIFKTKEEAIAHTDLILKKIKDIK